LAQCLSGRREANAVLVSLPLFTDLCGYCISDVHDGTKGLRVRVYWLHFGGTVDWQIRDRATFVGAVEYTVLVDFGVECGSLVGGCCSLT